MARVETNEKSLSHESRSPLAKTTSSCPFSIQDILGLDKTPEKAELYTNEGSYFSNTAETVVKIEPTSPTPTHIGMLFVLFILCIWHSCYTLLVHRVSQLLA